MLSKANINRRGFLMQRRREVDMTQGNITRHIISFALPLLVGNVFQQLYNMVDTWVVGRYVGNTAFSAVGTVGPITNLLIGFFGGLASGAGVVISQYYGAHRYDKVQDAVHTAVAMTLILSVVFTAVGFTMVPLMLKLIKMPPDVVPEATAYLRIYFAGITGLMIYNMGAGILRAIGDSQRPFYFLVVCAIMNIILDLTFVLAFDMGVMGVALATILSQAVSAIWVMRFLCGKQTILHIRRENLKFSPGVMGPVLALGISPFIMQSTESAIFIIFNTGLQRYGGDLYVATMTIMQSLMQLCFCPLQGFTSGIQPIISYNYGAKNYNRVKMVIKRMTSIGFAFTIIAFLVITNFPEIFAFPNPTNVVCAHI